MSVQWRKWGYTILPHHALSQLSGWVCRIEAPSFRRWLIGWFIAKYRVDMSLLEVDENSWHPIYKPGPKDTLIKR